MVFAPVWPPSAAAAFCPTVVPRAGSVFPPSRLAVGRLKRRSEFLRVAAVRRKWAAPGLILQAAKAEAPGSASTTRVGFTCSKKIGNAVERNRAKRRLRAAAAQILPDLARPGFDLVVIGRRETLLRPFGLLLQDLRTALQRVGAERKDEGTP
jgi:ribonuclease P protein component